MSYKHITQKESIAIEIYSNEWLNKSQIAKKLWRSPSTITREIEKYRNPFNNKYESNYASDYRLKIKSKSNQNNKTRIKNNSDLEIFILEKIKNNWTPEQISWRWKLETNESLSKDTVYSFIYKNHPELIKKHFRRKWKKYQRKRKEKYQLDERRMIQDRPVNIELRKIVWHWEWDTIIGKNRKWAIFTNVERKSWYLFTKKLKNKSWNEVLNAFIEMNNKIPKDKIKTTTVDNWREFAQHKMIEYFTNTKIYFANPYCSWERWTNENTNWLIRWYISKKTDFRKIKKDYLEEITKEINLRPRKRLNYKTPYEVFWWKKLKFAVGVRI
jgi:IS30 family transposase